MSELLRVEGLKVAVEGKEILKGLDLVINKGETHVIMGSNGAGKSTLFNTIMGNPKYVVTEGHIYFEGKEITHEPVNERAKAGIFMAFQAPISVQGITVENFIRNAKGTISGEKQRIMPFRKKLHQEMDALSMDRSYAERYVNDGFSGGERKKNEILQMCMLEPKLTLLDEIDSGLDVDAVRIVSQAVNKYHDENNSLLIITHHSEILQKLHPDEVHLLNTGRIENAGVEAEIAYRISAAWSVDANYSFLQMEHPVLAAPEHTLHVGASFTQGRWSVSTGLQYVEGLYTSIVVGGTGSDAQENFILWNLRAGFRISRKLRIFVDGENLLAQRYEINAGFPMPRATVLGGLDMHF